MIWLLDSPNWKDRAGGFHIGLLAYLMTLAGLGRPAASTGRDGPALEPLDLPDRGHVF